MDDVPGSLARPEGDVGVIYIITHLASGKRYVGQTRQTSPMHRIREHLSRALRHSERDASVCAFHEALAANGSFDGFTIKMLAGFSTHAELNDAERDHIDRLNSVIPNGFNTMSGGASRQPRVRATDPLEVIHARTKAAIDEILNRETRIVRAAAQTVDCNLRARPNGSALAIRVIFEDNSTARVFEPTRMYPDKKALADRARAILDMLPGHVLKRSFLHLTSTRSNRESVLTSATSVSVVNLPRCGRVLIVACVPSLELPVRHIAFNHKNYPSPDAAFDAAVSFARKHSRCPVEIGGTSTTRQAASLRGAVDRGVQIARALVMLPTRGTHVSHVEVRAEPVDKSHPYMCSSMRVAPTRRPIPRKRARSVARAAVQERCNCEDVVIAN